MNNGKSIELSEPFSMSTLRKIGVKDTDEDILYCPQIRDDLLYASEVLGWCKQKQEEIIPFYYERNVMKKWCRELESFIDLGCTDIGLLHHRDFKKQFVGIKSLYERITSDEFRGGITWDYILDLERRVRFKLKE